jgi:exodeoxyribonuclease V beta subunit
LSDFAILDRHLDIHHNYLLEASAGTGKTFSIENIVVRLLLESNCSQSIPLTIDQILVVTFTKKATRDLKLRIHANIEKCLSILQKGLETDKMEGKTPDFLSLYLEKGEFFVKEAIKRLEGALFCFDLAQIFTIHSFCSKMLRENVFEGNIGMGAVNSEQSGHNITIQQIIKDFIRTEVRSDQYGKSQLKIILKKQKHSSILSLINDIAYQIKKSTDIIPGKNYQTLFHQFCEAINSLRKKGYNYSETIVNDFLKQAPFYNKILVNGEVKKEILEKITRFSKLFEKKELLKNDFDDLIEDGLLFLDLLHPMQRNKKTSKIPYPILEYTNFIESVEKLLKPVIDEARHYPSLLARMAYESKKLMKRYFSEEEKLGYDDLLQSMQEALRNHKFVEKIRNNYKAAIVDEFQDTDPIQWSIFRKLFMEDSSWGSLYLVGDPKQSIYAFREADIYTYMDAAEHIGPTNKANLDTNYRSQPSLVDALNILFSSASKFITLPRKNIELKYQNVKAGGITEEKIFQDELGSIHWAIVRKSAEVDVEEDLFFPFILQEIQKLYLNDALSYHQFAILVATHKQGNSLAEYLRKWKIPVTLQKSGGIADSLALKALREVLTAVLIPRHASMLRIALGSKIIGWTHENICTLSDITLQEKITLQVYHLRKTLMQDGFGKFFQLLMQSSWFIGSSNVTENLLLQEGGLEFYNDLMQIAELLLEYQSASYASPEKILAYLDEFASMEIDEVEAVKRRQNSHQDAVQILTLHSSKGLEFDIVFALGLAERNRKLDEIVPNGNKEHPFRVPIIDAESETFRLFCQESDAEKMRQLYVGMTRAKHRLYLPLVIDSKPPKYGQASPMELFAVRIQQEWEHEEVLYQKLAEDYFPLFLASLNSIAQLVKISYSMLQINSFHFELPKPEGSICLHPPPVGVIPGQMQFIHSYTALAKKIEIISRNGFPHNFLSDSKSVHTLPSNSETGNLLHKILEKLPFGIKEAEISSFLRLYLEDTLFLPWSEIISKILSNVIKTPLYTDSISFSIGDLSPDRCYREMEFLYPTQEISILQKVGSPPGFLKGIIDMMFEYQGKYYLLDWKSNWLGPSQEYYQQHCLKIAMQENDYFLQAKVYQEALRRYLHIIDPRPFNEIFGGIFYIFLRGIDPSSTDNEGVFFIHNLAEEG